jgi:GNAT superfamily N-acetyltransferase
MSVSDYHVSFAIGRSCGDDDRAYLETITGTVLPLNEEYGEGPAIGSFTGYRLRRDWLVDKDATIDFFEAIDESQDTHEHFMAVFDAAGEYHPHVARVLADAQFDTFSPVLVAAALTLDLAHRGRGLGYAVVRAFIDTFGPGAALVIAQSGPIGQTKRGRARGVKRLRAYWEAFGFVPVRRGSEFLVLDLSLQQPSLSVLVAAREGSRRGR